MSETYAHRQREVFPDAQITILTDSGHFPYLDDPDAVAAVVIPFLRAQCAPRKPNRNSRGRMLACPWPPGLYERARRPADSAATTVSLRVALTIAVAECNEINCGGTQNW